jgi:ABC-type sugar transport system ATPase subunit
VMALCDRIIVMYKGEIMGDVDAKEVDVNQIGELMLGHREAQEATT